ncbi:MAG: TetR/AcrR family transcriptional regulator [Rubrivivax sp.]|nr:TetR/AcrR family transcriptional regulator [Rubrivivax sp.]
MNATPSKAPPRSAGTGDTLSARALKRRGLIKNAVAAVLERVGYRAMKVTDVAAEAGIAVGLFYHYFPDLCAATCEVLTDLVDDLSARLDELPKPEDRYQAVYRPTLLWAQTYEQHPGLMRCLVQVADEVPEFEALWLKTNDAWTRRIARSIARQFPSAALGERMSMSIAYALGSMIDGLLNEIYVHRNPELGKLLKTPAHSAELLAAIWYRALYLENPPVAEPVITVGIERLVRPELDALHAHGYAPPTASRKARK